MPGVLSPWKGPEFWFRGCVRPHVLGLLVALLVGILFECPRMVFGGESKQADHTAPGVTRIIISADRKTANLQHGGAPEIELFLDDEGRNELHSPNGQASLAYTVAAIPIQQPGSDTNSKLPADRLKANFRGDPMELDLRPVVPASTGKEGRRLAIRTEGKSETKPGLELVTKTNQPISDPKFQEKIRFQVVPGEMDAGIYRFEVWVNWQYTLGSSITVRHLVEVIVSGRVLGFDGQGLNALSPRKDAAPNEKLRAADPVMLRAGDPVRFAIGFWTFGSDPDSLGGQFSLKYQETEKSVAGEVGNQLEFPLPLTTAPRETVPPSNEPAHAGEQNDHIPADEPRVVSEPAHEPVQVPAPEPVQVPVPELDLEQTRWLDQFRFGSEGKTSREGASLVAIVPRYDRRFSSKGSAGKRFVCQEFWKNEPLLQFRYNPRLDKKFQEEEETLNHPEWQQPAGKSLIASGLAKFTSFQIRGPAYNRPGTWIANLRWQGSEGKQALVGERTIRVGSGLRAFDQIAVRLEPGGDHRLELQYLDDSGRTPANELTATIFKTNSAGQNQSVATLPLRPSPSETGVYEGGLDWRPEVGSYRVVLSPAQEGGDAPLRVWAQLDMRELVDPIIVFATSYPLHRYIFYDDHTGRPYADDRRKAFGVQFPSEFLKSAWIRPLGVNRVDTGWRPNNPDQKLEDVYISTREEGEATPDPNWGEVKLDSDKMSYWTLTAGLIPSSATANYTVGEKINADWEINQSNAARWKVRDLAYEQRLLFLGRVDGQEEEYVGQVLVVPFRTEVDTSFMSWWFVGVAGTLVSVAVGFLIWSARRSGGKSKNKAKNQWGEEIRSRSPFPTVNDDEF